MKFEHPFSKYNFFLTSSLYVIKNINILCKKNVLIVSVYAAILKDFVKTPGVLLLLRWLDKPWYSLYLLSFAKLYIENYT